MTAVDWAKPFIRQRDENLFYSYVDIFSENDWELDEFARQMLEVVAETKQNCTNLRLQLERTNDKEIVQQLVAKLREERDLYALYVTRYSQYFGSLDCPTGPSASVVYRERRFFREIRTSLPPLPLERPPPCPPTEQEGRCEDGKSEVHTEIGSETLCEVAVEHAVDGVITNLIGEAEPKTSCERRHRIRDSTVRQSIIELAPHVEGGKVDMEEQPEERIVRHEVAEFLPEVTKVEELLVGRSTDRTLEYAEDNANTLQESSDSKEDANLHDSFEIVSHDEIDEAVQHCLEEVLKRSVELNDVPLKDALTDILCEKPTESVAQTSASLQHLGQAECSSEAEVETELKLSPAQKISELQLESAIVTEEEQRWANAKQNAEDEEVNRDKPEIPAEQVLQQDIQTAIGKNIEETLTFSSESQVAIAEDVEVNTVTPENDGPMSMYTEADVTTLQSDENSLFYNAECADDRSTSLSVELSATSPPSELSEVDLKDHNANYHEKLQSEVYTKSEHFEAEEDDVHEEVYEEPASYGAAPEPTIAEPAELAVHNIVKSEEMQQYDFFAESRNSAERFPEESIYSNPPPRTYLSSISARPFSTASFTFQTCSTTYIPCPPEEDSRMISESSDVRTDPSYTVDVDEEFEDIGDDEFERAEREVIYDNPAVLEESIYEIPPSATSQRSPDAMRAEVPNSPAPRPVSPLLTLGRQRQMELGVTLHEEEEITYEEQELERKKRLQEIYAPPSIPEIAIDLDTEETLYYEHPLSHGLQTEAALVEERENHYDEPQVLSTSQSPHENNYSVPDVVPDNEYSEVPYAVSSYQAEHIGEEKEHSPNHSVTSVLQTSHRNEGESSLRDAQVVVSARKTSNEYDVPAQIGHENGERVYYRNIYEDLDVPQPAERNAGDRASSVRDNFPYYVEPDYTANAIRRMSRYNSWSQDASQENLRSKSVEYLNHQRTESYENEYHAEPAKPQWSSSTTLPRSFPRTPEPEKPVEQKRTVYVPKPASRVTSSVQDWSSSPSLNNVHLVHPQTKETKRAEAVLPPPLDLSVQRSTSNDNIGYGYLPQANKKFSPQSPTFVRIGVQTGTLGTPEVPQAPTFASSVLRPSSERAERQAPVFSAVKEPRSPVQESVVSPSSSSPFNAFQGVKLRSVAKPIVKEERFPVNSNRATEDFRNSAVFKRISRTAASLIEAENQNEQPLTNGTPTVEEEAPIYKYEVVRSVRETAVAQESVYPQVETHSQINETSTPSPIVKEPLSEEKGTAQPRKSWKVQVNTANVPILTPKALKMPEIRDSVPSTNGLDANQFKEESAVCKNWNPVALINKLYEIDYMPRKESKRSRFINMEGHLDIPVNDKNRVSELEKDWKRQYFRTKEGRLQWFVTHFADEHPVGDVLLAGCDIDANREDGTLSIHGGRDHTKMVVKAPLSLFDKWRQAFLSHAASSILDSYVQPIARPLPHMTEKIAIIELGSCSIRGGVLTMDPSLPQSFFPAIGCVSEDGSIAVGADALRPEVRATGQLVQPIPATDPAVERYNMNKPVVRECLQKVVDDLQIDPKRYKVLLSLPQNIPTALIGDLMKSLLYDVNFQGVSVTRQPSLILYSYDVTTGVVVDIGERLNIVPVIDGYVVENAIVSLPYGAQQIRESLRSKLSDHNMGLYSFQSPVERFILRYVMEETCYVATEYDAEAKKCSENESAVDVDVSLKPFETTSEMQSEFKINSSRFVATEGLFKPKRWGLDSKALHELVNEAVQLSPIDSRRTLFRNIYLSGGTSLLHGLAERLEVELTSLVPSTIHVQVHMSPWRYHAAFLGAQIVASSTQFDKSCVNKDSLGAFLVQLQSSAF
ncbi:hypothetical protein QR680_002304 [Steinernema hermaphroditum]|uniref:PH domain-containing protein n=1 Tax=Steinernema hermaphroditum TaxID=289476 RepID=A0AA39LHZ7_9BILA|nr:hypothetical protein QR680_002304 [Steinernema hermaphroditum]